MSNGSISPLKLQLEGLLGRMLLKKGENKEALAVFDHILQAPPDKVLGMVGSNQAHMMFVSALLLIIGSACVMAIKKR